MPQERLEKEKKLSKDLGQAATKLQQLLKVSQELLAKEKDTVNVLRDQLIGKVTDKYDLRPYYNGVNYRTVCVIGKRLRCHVNPLLN